jgi:hypothetical protein
VDVERVVTATNPAQSADLAAVLITVGWTTWQVQSNAVRHGTHCKVTKCLVLEDVSSLQALTDIRLHSSSMIGVLAKLGFSLTPHRQRMDNHRLSQYASVLVL